MRRLENQHLVLLLGGRALRGKSRSTNWKPTLWRSCPGGYQAEECYPSSREYAEVPRRTAVDEELTRQLPSRFARTPTAPEVY